MEIGISRNKYRNRFDINGINDAGMPEAKGKSGIAVYHGRCGSIIGWIAAKIFHKAVPITTKKGVICLNCKSLEKWRQRVAPDSTAINMHNPKAVKKMIKRIKNRNLARENMQPAKKETQPIKNEIEEQESIDPVLKPISFNFMFEEGFPLAKLSDDEKSSLPPLVADWKKRKPQESWSIEELAALIKQEKAALQKLLELVYLIPNSQNRYSEFGIEKFFNALELGLGDGLKVSFQPAVRKLWSCKDANNENWKLDELSRFLAVSQEALVNFFGEKKDQYSCEEIEQAFKSAENRQINEILEKKRTQKGSLRWAMT